MQKNKEISLPTYSAEDAALDRELERMASQEPILDSEPVQVLKKETVKRELLADYMEGYRPANTVNELLEQVHLAKEADCDSIEATPTLIKHYCRKKYPDDVGYFIFHDVKVWIAGFFETHSKKDSISVERRMFGESKVGV